MATLDQLIIDKISRLDSVPNNLFGKVEQAEKQIMNEILGLLNQFDTDPQGNILINQKNILLIDQVIVKINDVLFQGEYLEGVRAFANEFPEQLIINKDIFKKSLPNFSDKELFDATMKVGQERAIQRLSEGAITQTFYVPLRNIMNDNMLINGGIADLTKQLSNEILGTKEVDGRLLNWSKQTAYDNFAFSDRETSRVMSEDMDVRFWKYIGGLITDSRCFCVKRNGKIFSKAQIESWGNDPNLWNKMEGCTHGGGMIRGTNQSNIWTFLGGYRCQHSLIPVDENAVPQEILDNEFNPDYIPNLAA